MITKVTGQGFKGQTFEQKIGQKTLFIGANGKGKSAISNALQLAVMGYVPSEKPKKQNKDIVDAFAGNRKKMEVGVQIGKSNLSRIFSKSSKGAGKQIYKVGTGKYSQDDFAKAMASAGDPRPIDLSVFMALSDQKKIDEIFRLFPPDGDIKNIDGEVESAKDEINNIAANIRGLEKTAVRLAASKQKIELPAGTLAEVKKIIERTEAEYRLTKKNIAHFEMEQAKADAVAEEKKRAEDEAREKAEAQKQKAAPQQADEAKPKETEQSTVPEKETDLKDCVPHTATKQGWNLAPSPTDSIQTIINAMERAGCTACAALLIAKRELRKFTANGKDKAA